MDNIESFITKTKAKIVFGGANARYNHILDVIEMPPRATFENEAAYYTVVFHELIHWTNHPRRLERFFRLRVRENFKIWDFYNAYEEIIANLGAGLLCIRFELNPDALPLRAACIAADFKRTHESADTLAAAIIKARRAVRYLVNL